MENECEIPEKKVMMHEVENWSKPFNRLTKNLTDFWRGTNERKNKIQIWTWPCHIFHT